MNKPLIMYLVARFVEDKITFIRLLASNKQIRSYCELMHRTHYSDGSNSYSYQFGHLHSKVCKPSYINSKGDKYWHIYDRLHRDGDDPAIIYANNNKRWYKYGKLHRIEDKPAVSNDKIKEWWYDGRRHREGDKPAVIHLADPCKEYFSKEEEMEYIKYVKRYRDSDESWDYAEWWYNGKLQREGDKPALIDLPRRHTEWWYNGKKHRINNPAVIYGDGSCEWWENGEFIWKEDHILDQYMMLL